MLATTFSALLPTFALMGLGELWPLLIVAAGLGFTLWMLIECITKESNEGNDRVVWLLVILFATFFGALLYFFMRRNTRIRTLGR